MTAYTTSSGTEPMLACPNASNAAGSELIGVPFVLTVAIPVTT